MKTIISMALILISVLCMSCRKESDDSGDSTIYKSSHNTGRNCLGCHTNFEMAGSIYNKSFTSVYPRAKVIITTQANGAGMVLSIQTSDNSGNFHTYNPISFGNGVFVYIEGTSGRHKYMKSAITSGACNSCHGSSTAKVWAE